MWKAKSFIIFVILLIVHGSSSKPTENEVSQSRGIGSTLWSWITYPFYWWSSEEPVPINDQLIASTTSGPDDVKEVEKHNVTVWCNDQICTTMKCDKDGCKNNTCNIYDTKMTGECREFTTIVEPEEPLSPQPTTTSKPLPNVQQTESPIKTSEETSTKIPEVDSSPNPTTDSEVVSDKGPLELEAVLSSYDTTSTSTLQAGRDSFLDDMKLNISKYIKNMLEHFTTALANSLINNLDINTICIDGICYYPTCEDNNCKSRLCKYNLLSGLQECKDNTPGMLVIKPQKNKLVVERVTENTIKPAYNNEDNEIKIINKILNN